MALPDIYLVYDLLECLKGLDLMNHSHRISMTQSNSKISKRRFSEGLILMVYQKPEAWTLTNNTLHNEHV